MRAQQRVVREMCVDFKKIDQRHQSQREKGGHDEWNHHRAEPKQSKSNGDHGQDREAERLDLQLGANGGCG